MPHFAEKQSVDTCKIVNNLVLLKVECYYEKKTFKDCAKISTILMKGFFGLEVETKLYSTVAEWLGPLTVNAEEATVLGSIPASSLLRHSGILCAAN